MNEQMITGHDLIEYGWEQGPVLGKALALARAALDDGMDKFAVLGQLAAVRGNPEAYRTNAQWGEVAEMMVVADRQPAGSLRPDSASLQVWGEELIDRDSFRQIEQVARLPVTRQVALMPDAHIGYGLPIGGVAALDGAIAPYMVGVDIGCRMHATVFKRKPIHLRQKASTYEDALLYNSYFARSAPSRSERLHHPILDDERWALLPHALSGLQDLAVKQLGTSGGGNHFVEFTELRVLAENPAGLEPGLYIALVSHSGSRGVGYKIANYYSKVAEKLTPWLPKEYQKLAYLDYAQGDGEEYEMAMQLAGDFARANHEILHERIIDDLGAKVLATLQNHHNFAWQVRDEGNRPVFIHRKGATPAVQGVVGIIPGSMATPGFFVEGLGLPYEQTLEHPSLNSAAHGSGRVLGRRQANKSLNANKVRAFLKSKGVTLIGGGLDEAPDAYKDSRRVIAAQSDLVRVWAEFHPVIVRMAADGGKLLGRKR